MEEGEVRKRRKTILVVDDLIDWCRSISGILEDAGLNCICTDNRLDAVKIAIVERPDLVLSDVRLSESDESNEDGVVILREIKRIEATKGIPVILFTGYARAELVRDAYALGASAFVEKSDVLRLVEIARQTLLNAGLGIL